MKSIIKDKGIFRAYTLKNSNFIIEQIKFINNNDEFIDTGNIDPIKIYYNVNNAIKIVNLLKNGGTLTVENTTKGLSKGESDTYSYDKITKRFIINCGGNRKQYECDIIIKQEYLMDIQYLLYLTYEQYRNEKSTEKTSVERVQKYRKSLRLAKEREPILNLYPEAIEKYKDINYKNLKPDLSNQEVKNKLLRSNLFDEVINACKEDKKRRFI